MERMFIEEIITEAEKGIGYFYKDDSDNPSVQLCGLFNRYKLPYDASWCLAYLQAVFEKVESNHSNQVKIDLPKNIFRVADFWTKTKEEYKLHTEANPKPKRGMFTIMQRKRDGAGHIEIITDIIDSNTIMTIGANTSNPNNLSNQKRGVFKKKRFINGGWEEKRIIGYIDLEKALLFKGDTLSSL